MKKSFVSYMFPFCDLNTENPVGEAVARIAMSVVGIAGVCYAGGKFLELVGHVGL